MAGFFSYPIELLRGVGPARAKLLQTELRLFTYGDLIQYYPFRHLDRTQTYAIADLTDDLPNVQIRGHLRRKQLLGEGRAQRLSAILVDADGGELELVWFKGLKWVERQVRVDAEYIIFGKPTEFNGRFNIVHPELEDVAAPKPGQVALQPVYNTTEKLKNHHFDSKAIARLVAELLPQIAPHVPETLPAPVLDRLALMPRALALQQIHFPATAETLAAARFRLKFEELFYLQLKLLRQRTTRKVELAGQVFQKVPSVGEFYRNHLPFDLTGAQKRVLREIHADMTTGRQMNRLLQGDVGSGKTIVAFLAMLMAADNGAQACLMAPTEILADQHFTGLAPYAKLMNRRIAKLTGSTRPAARRELHAALRDGSLDFLVGTHALLEDEVQFRNLGLTIMDEQHRFGVAQRSKLWQKNPNVIPHVLVMTATPIPRTLAMTVYGDLDVSIIDELPAGRKPIQTVHRYEEKRPQVYEFLREEIKRGRQAYIVYPLIEENETLDLKSLSEGYDQVRAVFPEFGVSMVHGQLSAYEKDDEMQRFIRHETQILVATTVIEVGVNVPNASVMIIEDAQRFGLSQLHQLRGRVGRGAEQSYCVLLTSYKVSKDGRTRLETMVRTTDGFEIADVDLKLRGPGDLMGTQQSGILDLLIADVAKDGQLMAEARAVATEILDRDPELILAEHDPIRRQIEAKRRTGAPNWSRIS
ncbi:MAG: ATP-dependent DNA helicase RecG [Hymenobacteraceae bacterium]|nr:ATP-dependent DNA helicase RecG [Hymenobacteraceae bacterium]